MAKKQAAEGQVKVRVLTACMYGAANEVAVMAASEAKAAEKDGLVDSNADAVAYAESLSVDDEQPAA